MTTSSDSRRGNPTDPTDWRTYASRDDLLSMVDSEREVAASMARTMTKALDQLAENRSLLAQVAHHEATRGHPLYGAIADAADASLPHVLGRRIRAGDEHMKALRRAIDTDLPSCHHGVET